MVGALRGPDAGFGSDNYCLDDLSDCGIVGDCAEVAREEQMPCANERPRQDARVCVREDAADSLFGEQIASDALSSK